MLCDGGNLTAFLTPRPRPSADWPRDVGTQTRPPPLPRRQCLWVAVGVESRPPRGGKLRRAGGHRFARNGELRRHSLHCCQGSARCYCSWSAGHCTNKQTHRANEMPDLDFPGTAMKGVTLHSVTATATLLLSLWLISVLVDSVSQCKVCAWKYNIY